MARKADKGVLSPTVSMSYGHDIELDEFGLRKGNYTTPERRREILFNYDHVCTKHILMTNVCLFMKSLGKRRSNNRGLGGSRFRCVYSHRQIRIHVVSNINNIAH